MSRVTIGVGYVYNVDSVLATFFDPAPLPVNFMAVSAFPVTCQFVVPYHLYNGITVILIILYRAFDFLKAAFHDTDILARRSRVSDVRM